MRVTERGRLERPRLEARHWPNAAPSGVRRAVIEALFSWTGEGPTHPFEYDEPGEGKTRVGFPQTVTGTAASGFSHLTWRRERAPPRLMWPPSALSMNGEGAREE